MDADPQDVVVFVTYTVTDDARDFVDESLCAFFDAHPALGEVSGGGTHKGQDIQPRSVTDVDLFSPTRAAYHQLVQKLRDMQMPPETVLRSDFGIVPLYEIELPPPA